MPKKPGASTSTKAGAAKAPNSTAKRAAGKKSAAAEPAKAAGKESEFKLVGMYLLPDQRDWLDEALDQLPRRLSKSDLGRLAINRLREDVATGLDLEATLRDQVTDELERYPARARRGALPS